MNSNITKTVIKDLAGMQKLIGLVSKDLAQSRTHLIKLGQSQRRMQQLHHGSTTLLTQLNDASRCNAQLAQVGRGLFLSGQEGKGFAVVQECGTKLAHAFQPLESRRRLAQHWSRICPLYREGGHRRRLDMRTCLQEANYSECTNATRCEQERRSLYGHIAWECRQFCAYVQSHKVLQEVEALQVGHEKMQSFLTVVSEQSAFIVRTTQDCVQDATELVAASRKNAEALAQVTQCIRFSTSEWNEIIKECLAANYLPSVLAPFYNIYVLIAGWNCMRITNVILVLVVTAGVVLWFVLCFRVFKWRRENPHVAKEKEVWRF